MIGIPVGLIVIGYIWYISLVGRRNTALEALSSIDVQLRKRHDLLPNVLKIASKYMEHERELLTQLTELRTRVSAPIDTKNVSAVAERLGLEDQLQGLMTRLFAVAENYPDLKASEPMVTAQHSFEEVEGHISAARRFYNSACTDLNNAVQIFPGSMIARMAGISPMPYFEIQDAAVRQPVDASDFLK